jgi:hypothetical protein
MMIPEMRATKTRTGRMTEMMRLAAMRVVILTKMRTMSSQKTYTVMRMMMTIPIRVHCLMTMTTTQLNNAKYRVPLVRGAGAGRKPNNGRPDKPNTDGISEKEKEEALGKWEKDWKRARNRDRRRSAHDKADDTITYTGVASELL